MIKMSELIEIIKNNFEARQVNEAPFHVHVDGVVGASNLHECIYRAALKHAGYPLPQLTGERAEKGALNVGHLWHTEIERVCVEGWLKKNIMKQTDTQIKEEVFCFTELIPDVKIETPIDLCEAQLKKDPKVTKKMRDTFEKYPSYFKRKSHEFGNNVVEYIYTLNEKIAEYKRIFDLKTASDKYSFWKYLNNDLSDNYKAQAHAMMKATGLKECTFIFINKANLKMYEKICTWDEIFWQDLQKRWMRVLKLSDELLNCEDPTILESDLDAFNEDNYCVGCPLAEVKEEIQLNGQIRSEIVRACDPTMILVKQKAIETFEIGSRWKRGRLHVIIKEFNENFIVVYPANGKDQTEMYDSFIFAVQKYKPI